MSSRGSTIPGLLFLPVDQRAPQPVDLEAAAMREAATLDRLLDRLQKDLSALLQHDMCLHASSLRCSLICAMYRDTDTAARSKARSLNPLKKKKVQTKTERASQAQRPTVPLQRLNLHPWLVGRQRTAAQLAADQDERASGGHVDDQAGPPASSSAEASPPLATPADVPAGATGAMLPGAAVTLQVAWKADTIAGLATKLTCAAGGPRPTVRLAGDVIEEAGV